MSFNKINNLDFDYSNLYYSGDDLGVIVDGDFTSFKIWAPAAEKVELLLLKDENYNSIKKKFSLEKNSNGCWGNYVSENLAGNYYLFVIDYGECQFEVIDPYARAVSTNSKFGYIVDLSKTNPVGWKNDKRVKLEKATDAVIYEVHVKDFSISSESGIELKGEYLAFTERGTKNRYGFQTGIDHLKDLGITHVHLLPVFDFATVDDNNSRDYNWGYDPYYYNVPEGSYASNPSDETRILEFKKMVKALHDEGIGVIMDVVYNHTYYTEKSTFSKTAPGYFYRKKNEDDLANGSGVGNEFASERAMARKFIIDSLCYWTNEYHIDGFRFDLMRILDKKTMDKAEDKLHEIDSSILLYGEPWSALPPQLHHDKQMMKGAQKEMNIAAFNDHFRDAVKGDTNGAKPGFVNGEKGLVKKIKQGIVGGIYYNDNINDFTISASESINYVSAHDNLTLWDKLKKTNSEKSKYIRIRMDKMAQAIIFTSLGIPFLHGGEEFLRTKYGDSNSYSSGNSINMLKWERKTKYHNTFNYYSGLIKMRQSFGQFRMNNPEKIRNNIEFLESPTNTIAYKLKPCNNNFDQKELVILYNPNQEWIDFEIGTGDWGIIVDDRKAGNKIFNIFNNNYVKVAPISVMVLVSI